MRKKLLIMGVTFGLLVGAAHLASAQSQRFAGIEAALGATQNHWAFLTAWDLTGGGVQVSPNWFNGEFIWNFNQTHYQRWIAKFIYDQTTGATRELQWSFRQIHIQ